MLESCARYRVDCVALSAPLSLDITGILLITGDCAAVFALILHKQEIEVVMALVLVMSRKMR